MKWLNDLFGRRPAPASVARDRLKLVLTYDRVNCQPDILEMLKNDIMKVLLNYMDIDEEELDVQISQTRHDQMPTAVDQRQGLILLRQCLEHSDAYPIQANQISPLGSFERSGGGAIANIAFQNKTTQYATLIQSEPFRSIFAPFLGHFAGRYVKYLTKNGTSLLKNVRLCK